MNDYRDTVVFLDRDGVINESLPDGPIYSLERFRLLPGAATAIKRLNQLGIRVIVITNQGGINHHSRLFSWEEYQKIESLMLKSLDDSAGAKLDAIYVCPHAEYQKCQCRKPKIGLFLQAEKEHKYQKAKSFFVGDRVSDIKAGQTYGVQTILIRSSWQIGVEQELLRVKLRPAQRAESLLEAVSWIEKELESSVNN